MFLSRLAALPLVASIAVGCAPLVELTPQGQQVQLSGPDQVAGCQRLGQTTVSVLAQVAGVERDLAKVTRELNTLARNSAVDLKGDTIVPLTEVAEGKRTYAVYRCSPH